MRARAIAFWALAGLAASAPAGAAPSKAAPVKAAKPVAKRAAMPRWAPRVPPGLRAAVKHWHEPIAGAHAPRDASGRAMLVLTSLYGNERVELEASSDEGGFGASSLDRAAHVLRDPRTGLEHPVEPALLDLVYQAQRHFDTAEVRVLSGYRAPNGKGHSNHGRGRAMDVIFPGVRDADLTDWARARGFSGVGLYPTSGFCHLDVRPQSYFWVDRSGPGQRNREQAVGGGEALRSDVDAKRQHRAAIAAYRTPGAVGADWGGGLTDDASGGDNERDDD